MDNCNCENCNDLLNGDFNERGFYLSRDKNNQFHFGFRCLDKIDEPKFVEIIRSIKNKPKFHMSLTGEFVIKYCPWCGKRLPETKILKD